MLSDFQHHLRDILRNEKKRSIQLPCLSRFEMDRIHINMSKRVSSSLGDVPLKLLSLLSGLRSSLEKVSPNSSSSTIEDRRSDDDSVDVGGAEDVGFGGNARDHHLSGMGRLTSFVVKSFDEGSRRLSSVSPTAIEEKKKKVSMWRKRGGRKEKEREKGKEEGRTFQRRRCLTRENEALGKQTFRK